MAQLDPVLKALRETRSDYDEEVRWHRFLLDAAHGTGGFRGRFGPTAISHLGWAAEAYAKVSTFVGQPPEQRDTYLDQFPREDAKKFAQRIDCAHYTNFVGPIHEILVSYINKHEMAREGEQSSLSEWRNDVDGKGTTWDQLQAEYVRALAMLLGWMPVLFDGPPIPRPTDTLATTQGIDLRAFVLFPVNILDWDTDESGDVTAVKIRTVHKTRPNLMSAPVEVEHYSLWYPDRVARYEVRKEDGQPETVSGPVEVAHSFGRVPFVSFRAKPTPGDKVRGLSFISDLAIEARTHFNLNSEMRDHVRGQVFAILGVPVIDVKADVGEIVAGNNSAIKVPHTSNMPLHFVAPPATVASTLEAARETCRKSIYRMASVIDEEDARGAAASGEARAYRFDHTNKRLQKLTASLADSEQRALRLVASIKGAANPNGITVSPPTDFSIEELASDIENVMSALELGFGPTAETQLKQRLYRRLAPNTPQSIQAVIDDEIEERSKQAEQDAAMQRELQQAALDGQGDGDNPGVDAPGSTGEEG